jgi:hypothetical protein
MDINTAILNRRIEGRAIVKRAKDEGRDELTVEEAARADHLADDIAKLEILIETEAEIDRKSKQYRPTDAARRSVKHYEDSVRIGDEARTYNKDSDPSGDVFMSDIAKSFLYGDAESQQRISRHQREEMALNPKRSERAAGDLLTSGLPGIVFPQYLLGDYDAVPTSGRPFADIATKRPLPPEGLKIEVPYQTTAATVAKQGTQLTGVSATSIVTATKEIDVFTYAGQQTVARQAIDRGRISEQIVLADLKEAADANLDNAMLNAATIGLSAVATRVEYDDATPTFAALYPKIVKAAGDVAGVGLNRFGPTHVLMHPRRWSWAQAEMTDTWPLVGQPNIAPMQGGTANGREYASGVSGYLPCGLAVVQDANIVTAALDGADTGGTEDVLYVVAAKQAILYEDDVVYIRAEQPAAASLGVLFVVYQYAGFVHDLRATHRRVDGTGTVPPA